MLDFQNNESVVNTLMDTEEARTIDRERKSHGWRILRPHHWVKNLLLFLPIVMSHQLDRAHLKPIFGVFVLFSFVASAIYILNDIIDLESDKKHAWKKTRPLASGAFPIRVAVALSVLLLCASLFAAYRAYGSSIAGLLAAYAIAAVAYSVWLKRFALIDVFLLTGFYLVRLLIGGRASAVPLSVWFLAFSGFFFFSLSMAKRYSELLHTELSGMTHDAARGYVHRDRELLSALGVGGAFAAVVILAIYTQNPDVTRLYPRPKYLLLLCPIILYWTTKVWLKAHRGELDSDPILVLLKDRSTYLAGALAALIFALSMQFSLPH